MNFQGKLERINEDIEAGLKLKSTERLRNLINEYPNELVLWERLAELYYESGFIDAAGRYWILTEPTENRIKVATETYMNSVNNSGTQILRDITFRGSKDVLSEYAKDKLTELETNSKLKSDYIPTFKPKQNKQKRKNSKQIETFKDKLTKWGLLAILILIVLFTIIGFLATISWII